MSVNNARKGANEDSLKSLVIEVSKKSKVRISNTIAEQLSTYLLIRP